MQHLYTGRKINTAGEAGTGRDLAVMFSSTYGRIYARPENIETVGFPFVPNHKEKCTDCKNPQTTAIETNSVQDLWSERTVQR